MPHISRASTESQHHRGMPWIMVLTNLAGCATVLSLVVALSSEWRYTDFGPALEGLGRPVQGNLIGGMIAAPFILASIVGSMRQARWGHWVGVATCLVFLAGKSATWLFGYGPISLAMGAPVFLGLLFLLSGPRWHQYYGKPFSTSRGLGSLNGHLEKLTLLSLLFLAIVDLGADWATSKDQSLRWREWGATKQVVTELRRGFNSGPGGLGQRFQRAVKHGGGSFEVDFSVLRDEGESIGEFLVRMEDLTKPKTAYDVGQGILEDPLTKAPWASGAKRAWNAAQIWDAVGDWQNGKASREQQRAVLEYMIEGMRDTTLGHKVARIVSEAPSLIVSFVPIAELSLAPVVQEE